MSLFEHYKSTPESIVAQRAAALADSEQLVGVRTQVLSSHVNASSGIGGILAIPAARLDPAYVNADRSAKLKLIASASLLQWATSVRTYDTGIDTLNRTYDDAKAAGFGVDPDHYYLHGAGMTQAQRDAAYHHALGAAESSLIAMLTREKGRLDATLDDGATTAKTTLNTDPSDANLTKLFQAGLFPIESTLSFSGIDVTKLDLTALVANLKAMGLIPDSVDAATLQEMESILHNLSSGGDLFADVSALGDLADLLQDLDPATLTLFIAILPEEDLDKWNDALERNGTLLGNDYQLALSNLMLQSLTEDEVRRFMRSMTTLQPGLGQLDGSHWKWLEQELGADSAAMDEINQGGVGDCWFIASIGAELQKDPDFVQDHIHDNGNGTYTVTFYDDGEPVQVTVDGEIPASPDGGAAGAHTDSDWSLSGPAWLAIYEKAYASYKGGSYQDIKGGWGDEGMSDLTGHDADRSGGGIFGPSLEDIQDSLDSGHPVTVGTGDDAGFFPWQGDDDERIDDQKLVSHHEYIVKEVVTLPDGQREIVLLNPWGPKGSAPYEVHLSQAEYYSWINEVAIDG